MLSLLDRHQIQDSWCYTKIFCNSKFLGVIIGSHEISFHMISVERERRRRRVLERECSEGESARSGRNQGWLSSSAVARVGVLRFLRRKVCVSPRNSSCWEKGLEN
ncbi:hypothetical protein K1719_031235 [Acacia pycnantha]|nr:hypothetical protein K1719_031235 [Acacia pycnantha]